MMFNTQFSLTDEVQENTTSDLGNESAIFETRHNIGETSRKLQGCLIWQLPFSHLNKTMGCYSISFEIKGLQLI